MLEIEGFGSLSLFFEYSYQSHAGGPCAVARCPLHCAPFRGRGRTLAAGSHAARTPLLWRSPLRLSPRAPKFSVNRHPGRRTQRTHSQGRPRHSASPLALPPFSGVPPFIRSDFNCEGGSPFLGALWTARKSTAFLAVPCPGGACVLCACLALFRAG